MPDSIHPKRPIRSRRARLLVLATLVSAVLVAGCGGSSPSPTAAAGGGTAGSTASAGRPAGSLLAFAKCMRANGVPDFPDPNPGGGRSFSIPVGVSASPAFKAAQARCQKLAPLTPVGAGLTTHPSGQTLAKLLRIAQCMRRHGVAQFPDPTTSIPSTQGGFGEITDFDGAILAFPSTINLQAPAYRQALTACGAPPLGLPH
jgi:hypothetical protein